MAKRSFSVLILAAGKATRFKSEHSKVLHRLAGRPLGEYALRAALAAEPERVYVVVGHEAEQVQRALARPGVDFIEQREQLGTGHALQVARAELERCESESVLVLVADAPLVRAETLCEVVEAQQHAGAAAAVVTTWLADPTGYGRIVRVGGSAQRSPRAGRGAAPVLKASPMRAIVEEKNATTAERRIHEVSSGILCFARAHLLRHLDELTNDNSQSEYLLTDLVGIFHRRRLKVLAFPVADSGGVLGVNDRVELARIEKLLRLRKAEALAKEGVTVVDPAATYIDDDVVVGTDTVIEPGASLLGATRIGSGSTIRSGSVITDSTLGDRVMVRPYSVITACEIASEVIIGPFAHLRDGAVIAADARIGNFVEVKKSRVGRGTKAWHLTYLGDATLGEDVNIGAGTVTCNYDGVNKNPTTINDRVFIGSGSMLVAPVRIGARAYVAAGSTITEDVPADALALGRARQVVKEGWAKRPKPADGT
jgi:bifunctional UDP-N-acetylglucosamine pyrophosphorylase / glucosamine-1-phosphate N-acetyltransferase